MAQAALQPQAPAEDQRPKWLNSPVTFFTGKLTELHQHVPEFERRRFGINQPGGEVSGLNRHRDVIVRRPFKEDRSFIPVGVVSTDYALVPHTTVLDAAAQALCAAEISPKAVNANLSITEYGERMILKLRLPGIRPFDPGDSHEMAPVLEIHNSVDGSMRFRAVMSWLRLVCSNGLVLRVKASEMSYRHESGLCVGQVKSVLAFGLRNIEVEEREFGKWWRTAVTRSCLAPWADTELHDCWGFKAAARAFHIACSGFDVEIRGQYKDEKPTTIPVRRTTPVPGAPEKCRNLFDVSQILAWLAKERRDVQEQLEWRGQIPGLLKSLTGRSRQGRQYA